MRGIISGSTWAKPLQQVGGYWIGFLQFLPYEQSSWLLDWFFSTHCSSIWKKHLTNTKQVDIKLFIHVHFKWVENHHHFYIFQFLIRRTQQIPHWTITTASPRIPHDDYQLSMKTIWDHEDDGITHDDDQLSTKTIQRNRLEIMKMMVSWKQSNNRREKDCEEEESFFEDIVSYILYLILGLLWYM